MALTLRAAFCCFLATVAIGSAQTSTAPPLSCSTQTLEPAIWQLNGQSEPVPDIVIKCQGGTAGGRFLGNVQVFFGSGKATDGAEPLLLIDEPAPSGRVTGQNTFTGRKVADNSVAFLGVTFLAPGQGSQRTLRISGLKVNLAGVKGTESGAQPTRVLAAIVFTNASSVPLQMAPDRFYMSVGVVLPDPSLCLITGTVRDENGTGVSAPGVKATGLGGDSPWSSYYGVYALPAPCGYSGTVTAVPTDLIYEPPTRSYSAIRSHQRGQDFKVLMPRVKAVVNAASYENKLAPGGLISVFIENFKPPATRPSGVPLPNELAGVRLILRGPPMGSSSLTAPLVFVGPSGYDGLAQVNAQIPYEVPEGRLIFDAPVYGLYSRSFQIDVLPAAPGILLHSGNRAVAQNPDYSLNSPQAPAKPGSVATVYLTGIGKLDGTLGSGQPAPTDRLLAAALPASATVGGKPARLGFLGLTPGFVGLAQANIELPDLAAGDHEVVITVGGVTSNSGLLAVGGN